MAYKIILRIPLKIWYNTNDVMLAWDGFIRATGDPSLSSNSPNFQHELIDVTRQSLQDIFRLLYDQLVIAFNNKNIAVVQ